MKISNFRDYSLRNPQTGKPDPAATAFATVTVERSNWKWWKPWWRATVYQQEPIHLGIDCLWYFTRTGDECPQSEIVYEQALWWIGGQS